MLLCTNTKNLPVKYKGMNGTDNMAQKATPNNVDAQELWKGILRRVDTNGDGRLSKKELKAAFKILGSSLSGWHAFRAFCNADENGDGFIDEAELYRLLQYTTQKGYVL